MEDIIRIFASDRSRGFTINQVSKKLNKSYGYTNKTVRELINDHILNKLIVGNSIYCTLNMDNPRTLLLCALTSVPASIDKLDQEFISKLADKAPVDTIFREKTVTYVVTANAEQVEHVVHDMHFHEKIEVLDRAEFKAKKFSMNKIKVLYGFEAVWRL